MNSKVLMFGWEFPPHNSGGLGTACLGITKALASEGTDVTFVLPKKVPVDSKCTKIVFADTDRIKFKVIDSPLHPYITSEVYSNLFGEKRISVYGKDLFSEVMRYALAAAKVAEEEEHDVIYAHDWLSFGAGLQAKKVSGKPLIVHVHATEFDRCGGADGVNKDVYDIERKGMHESDKIVAVSNFTKHIIVKHYGVPEEKVVVVHNGIDPETAPSGAGHRSPLQSYKDSGYKVVLFLGRITLQKGPDYFLRAAKRVLEHNPKVLFLMSGSGDMERQMMEMAARLKIADKVLFPGFLRGADQYEAYRLADLFVMPSVSEPFGITPLEAMTVGTPVLISRQSGVSEVVKHALKVDFWDVEEMANMILSVVGHPALKQSLRENGKREVSGITWCKAAKKIVKIIKDLLKS